MVAAATVVATAAEATTAAEVITAVAAIMAATTVSAAAADLEKIMHYARLPARQPYYGPIGPDGRRAVRAIDAPANVMARAGDLTPATREFHRMMHGRYLSGLGQEPAIGPQGEDPLYADDHLQLLEHEDDVYGSGIFDPEGRATSNAEMGIFTSTYSLPGPIAREVPYAVSRDVTDVVDGGEVVFVPGGGFYHIEDGGRRAASPVLGPTLRPPRNVPAPMTDIATPYVNIQPEWAARPPLNAGAPVLSPPTFKPPRTALESAVPVRSWPAMQVVPEWPVARRVPFVPGVQAFGQAPTGASAGQLAVAGLALGAVLGLVVGALSAHKGRA